MIAGISSIRYDLKNDRWKAPKKITEQILKVMKGDCVSVKMLSSQLKQNEPLLHRMILARWDEIFDDGLFAYARNSKPFFFNWRCIQFACVVGGKQIF